MYLVLSEFTSRPVSLPASNRVSAFFFMIFMFSPNKLTGADQTLMFPFQFHMFLFQVAVEITSVTGSLSSCCHVVTSVVVAGFSQKLTALGSVL
jgi:hypothetical protein